MVKKAQPLTQLHRPHNPPCTVSTLGNVPDQPSRQDKLYSLELNQPAARLRDLTTFERNHSSVLEKEVRKRRRERGESAI